MLPARASFSSWNLIGGYNTKDSFLFMHVYFISGLGADERVFERIQLPEQVNVHFIHWLEPLPKESFSDYCLRLSAQITHKDKVVLIGLSFGGMVCIEISKFIPVQKIILLSSIATASELPLRFRLVNSLKLHRFVPAGLLKTPNPFTYWWFGVRTPREKFLLRNFLQRVSSNYLKWSINAVFNWTNKERPMHVYQIHGTNDRIFPYKKIKADVLLPGAGHLMVHDQAETISEFLRQALTKEK